MRGFFFRMIVSITGDNVRKRMRAAIASVLRRFAPGFPTDSALRGPKVPAPISRCIERGGWFWPFRRLRRMYWRNKSSLPQAPPNPRPPSLAALPCTIIIPVCNQPRDIRACVQILKRCTDEAYRLVLIDNASDSYEARMLEELAASYPQTKLLHIPEPVSPAAACNAGLQEAGGGPCVFLDARMRVAPGWLARMRRCAQSDARIAAVSPLSNGAAHLWLRLNPGDSPDGMAQRLGEMGLHAYPDMALPDDGCLYVAAGVMERLGGLDAAYATLAGALADLSLRVRRMGEKAACCEEAYVFRPDLSYAVEEAHARWADGRRIAARLGAVYDKAAARFQVEEPLDGLRRRVACQRPPRALAIEESKNYVYERAVDILKEPDLAQRKAAYADALQRYLASKRPRRTHPRIVFLANVLNQTGGALSVAQLVNDLISLGHDARLIVRSPDGYNPATPLLAEPVFYPNRKALLEHLGEADIVVGTLWPTMYYIMHAFLHRPSFVPAYFVQDFEPFFYPETDHATRCLVQDTYSLTPFCFAKTPWICEQVRAAGGHIQEVPPALDLDLFYPREVEPSDTKIILAMLRPSTPRRGFGMAIDVLARLAMERRDIEIHVFGASERELEKHAIPFAFTNHGILSNEMLPALYSRAYLYADFSEFHGFGRTVAEAMACGAPCVITESGGVSAFARDGHNCLMAPPNDAQKMAALMRRLLDHPLLHKRLSSSARESVAPFERMHSARETAEFLLSCLQ